MKRGRMQKRYKEGRERALYPELNGRASCTGRSCHYRYPLAI
jgi:hypothetical protein